MKNIREVMETEREFLKLDQDQVQQCMDQLFMESDAKMNLYY